MPRCCPQAQAQGRRARLARHDDPHHHEVRFAACRCVHEADRLLYHRILPREVDPLVYNMSMEDPNGATFAGIGGLGDQIRELREVSRCCPVFALMIRS